MDSKNQNQQKENIPKFRGLYRYVNISVKSLDRIIIVCIVVIVAVTLFALRDPGFTVNFDSRGGTDVEVSADKYQYGEQVDEPQAPTREGYTFTGWYIDEGCTVKWDMEKGKVESSFTLYAGWEKNS